VHQELLTQARASLLIELYARDLTALNKTSNGASSGDDSLSPMGTWMKKLCFLFCFRLFKSILKESKLLIHLGCISFPPFFLPHSFKLS
jgi:hypothetical protein